MIRYLAFSVSMLLVPNYSFSQAEGADKDLQALNVIADFADRICKDIPLKGKASNLELSGDAKAELKGLLKKVADLGIKGAVKYQDLEYEGLLQEDLVSAISKSSDCKLEVWKDLKGKILRDSNVKKND